MSSDSFFGSLTAYSRQSMTSTIRFSYLVISTAEKRRGKRPRQGGVLRQRAVFLGLQGKQVRETSTFSKTIKVERAAKKSPSFTAQPTN